MVRLNAKLQALQFPRVTQIQGLRRNRAPGARARRGPLKLVAVDDILSPGYLLAREIIIQLHLLRSGEKVRQTEFGQRASDSVSNAIWRQDVEFLQEFVKGFQAAKSEYEPGSLDIYRFMLAHHGEISALRSVTEIYKFVTSKPDLNEVEYGNFARLCREIGLPVR